MNLIIFSCKEKPFDLAFYTNIYCVGARINTFMSISDGLGPYFFRRRTEKTRPMKEEMEKSVDFPPKSSFFIVIMIKVLFATCTLTWRVNNYSSCHGRGIKRKNESTSMNNKCIVEVFFLFYNSVNCR